VEALKAGWQELQDLNYVTLIDDDAATHIFIVQPEPPSDNARTVKRLLLDDSRPAVCPWGEHRLPRTLRAGREATDPKAVWHIEECADVIPIVGRDFTLCRSRVFCKECLQERYFLSTFPRDTEADKVDMAAAVAEGILDVITSSSLPGKPSSEAKYALDSLKNARHAEWISLSLGIIRREIKEVTSIPSFAFGVYESFHTEVERILHTRMPEKTEREKRMASRYLRFIFRRNDLDSWASLEEE
jgi:hypothetical protein